MKHLEWSEVPKKFRLLKGVKHAFFTNHAYNEIIIPELRGQNVMSLKSYEKRFAYGNGHVTSVLIRNCRDWNVPAESVIGNTPFEGEQDVVCFYTSEGFIRVKTLLRGGILFLNGDYFDRGYFVCPTIDDYQRTMTWLLQLGNLLNPHRKAS